MCRSTELNRAGAPSFTRTYSPDATSDSGRADLRPPRIRSARRRWLLLCRKSPTPRCLSSPSLPPETGRVMVRPLLFSDQCLRPLVRNSAVRPASMLAAPVMKALAPLPSLGSRPAAHVLVTAAAPAPPPFRGRPGPAPPAAAKSRGCRQHGPNWNARKVGKFEPSENLLEPKSLGFRVSDAPLQVRF